MAKRHYTDNDFVCVSTYRDDYGYGCKKGYCRVCGGDMQRFWEKDGTWGPVQHHNSHKYGGIKTAIPQQPKKLTALEKILSN